jgi:hypothetical protein
MVHARKLYEDNGMSGEFGYQGTKSQNDSQGSYNATLFAIKQALSRINTCTLVKVVAVTNAGGLSPVGFVDVQPLVNQVDGANNSMPHQVLHQLPYFRLQGGSNAVILDPQVGDVGIAVFADHDISSIAKTKKQGNPGSWRRFSMADGLYIGGVLNGTPVQYVQFTAAGINVVSPTKVTITAPETDIIGLLKNNGVNVGSTHTHGGVSPGGSNTGGPA